MAKILRVKGGTTTQTNAFTGVEREVTVDTTKDVLVVHDGVTAGGFPVAAKANNDGSISFIKKDGTTVGTISTNGNLSVTGTATATQLITTSNGDLNNPALRVGNTGTSGVFGSLQTVSLSANGSEGLRYTQNDLGSPIGHSYQSKINGFLPLYPQFGVRAWVNFNGTNGAIRASGNVSSVTRNAAGDYTINFTTAMPDANYAWSGNQRVVDSATATSNSANHISLHSAAAANSQQAGSLRVSPLGAGNATPIDSVMIFVQVSR